MDGWEEILNNSIAETKIFNSTNFNDYEIQTKLKGFMLHKKTGNNVKKKNISYVPQIIIVFVQHLMNFINERLDSSER